MDRQFETGAKRGQVEGRGRFDLLPTVALEALAKRLEHGAARYGAHNWRRGIPLSSFLDSGMRHMTQLLAGDTSEDHAGAVLFNVAGFIDTLAAIERGELPPSLDDRYRPSPARPFLDQVAHADDEPSPEPSPERSIWEQVV